MKSLANNTKTTIPVKPTKGTYAHHPVNTDMKEQQHAMREVLRSDLVQPKLLQRQAEPEEEEEVQTKLLQRQKQPEEEEELQTKLLQRQGEPEEEEELQTKLLQRQAEPEEEEELQTKLLQRQGEPEEEEEVQTKLLQRQGEPEEEEELQTKLLQRQGEPEEEEELQTKLLQRQGEPEEEEELQTKLLQRQGEPEEEEELQTKLLQRQEQPEEEEEVQTKLLQRQAEPEEEEELQTKLLQRQAEPEEEEEVQTKLLQRQGEPEEEEEEVQTKLLQRQGEPEEEEELQTKLLQRQAEPEEEEEEVQPKLIQLKSVSFAPVGLSQFSLANLKRQTQSDQIRRALRPGGIQAKLTVGKPNDKYEQEADRVADQVMSMPNTSVQRQTDENEEDKTVQTKPLYNQITPVIQRKTSLQAKGSPELNADAEQKIEQMRGHGESLPEDVQQETEEKIGADFSGVNIHDNSAAHDLNRQVNARAFTTGNDIFFGAGEYAPNTDSGKRLLSHELTHVVQQNSSVQKSLQRAATLTDSYENKDGKIDTSAKTIQIKKLQVPTFKNKFYQSASGKLDGGAYAGKPTWRRNESTGGEARDTNQISKWETAVRAESDSKLAKKLKGAQKTNVGGKSIYYFSYNAGKSFLFGTEQSLKERTRRPLWTMAGVPVAMQVDHQIEHQTYGADSIENMWLLASGPNGQSGSEIRGEIRSKVGSFVTHVQDKVLNPPADENDARTHYNVYFDPIKGGLGGYGSVRAKHEYYTKSHIEAGDHLQGLNPMSQSEIDKSGILDGDAENISIFPSSTGGFRYQLTKDKTGTGYHLNTKSIRSVKSQNFEITGVTFDTTTKQGSINIIVPSHAAAAKLPVPMTPVAVNPIMISPMDGIEWGGKFDAASLKNQVKEALKNFPGLSPLRIDDVNLGPGGIALTGTITSTLPLLEGASVSFELDGTNLRVWKTFSAEDIKIPSPFSIDGASLTLGINNKGLFVSGDVAFGIKRIGKGRIGAKGAVSFGGETGMSLDGEFNFDERIFGEGTTAQVRVGYAEGKWSMGGTITIPEGKVPGVTSASINVDYSEEKGFAATGDATLSIPGVESGSLEITQNEESGFSIGGKFGLSADTPGIRGGSISAQVKEKQDGSGYAVSASGTAQPDIPGINSELKVEYNDGAFTAEVDAQYARGMLSGRIHAGVTNRSVNQETGELSATAEEGNPLVVYGGGSLTLKLTPWLQGTAGVRFAPNGEITITGEIGLPDQLEIFARKELNKSIFNIAVQAPIFPGIVAEIGGGLSATAGIGPGVIDQLSLRVEYNPDREQDTRVSGKAHLNIPADAGLRLAVRAGIGLGITGASATGGLEIGGTLGISGAAEAGVNIEWTPATGIDLRAHVGIHAQPSFKFDISGYVSVRALGFSVYDQRWELASFTYGSNMRLGIKLPIRYQSGKPFDISLSDVEFEVPDIDPGSLLRGLISRIA